jgi:hypothetical protein
MEAAMTMLAEATSIDVWLLVVQGFSNIILLFVAAWLRQQGLTFRDVKEEIAEVKHNTNSLVQERIESSRKEGEETGRLKEVGRRSAEEEERKTDDGQ